MSILLNLKQSYLAVIAAVALSIVLLFIDSKINKKEASKATYLKTAFIVGITSIFVVYVNTLKGKIDEEIISGIPPF
jgi:hypothetical protein